MSFGDAMTGIGGALGGVGSIIGAVSNIGIQKKNYELEKLAQETNVALQKQTWQREDNAVQRCTADMKAAGFNPVLAAGQAASTGSPIRLEAP